MPKWFKTDGGRFKEQEDAYRLRIANDKDIFIHNAIAAGFTKQQADFMVEYMSLINHQHSYYSNMHWMPTRQIAD